MECFKSIDVKDVIELDLSDVTLEVGALSKPIVILRGFLNNSKFSGKFEYDCSFDDETLCKLHGDQSVDLLHQLIDCSGFGINKSTYWQKATLEGYFSYAHNMKSLLQQACMLKLVGEFRGQGISLAEQAFSNPCNHSKLMIRNINSTGDDEKNNADGLGMLAQLKAMRGLAPKAIVDGGKKVCSVFELPSFAPFLNHTAAQLTTRLQIEPLPFEGVFLHWKGITITELKKLRILPTEVDQSLLTAAEPSDCKSYFEALRTVIPQEIFCSEISYEALLCECPSHVCLFSIKEHVALSCNVVISDVLVSFTVFLGNHSPHLQLTAVDPSVVEIVSKLAADVRCWASSMASMQQLFLHLISTCPSFLVKMFPTECDISRTASESTLSSPSLSSLGEDCLNVNDSKGNNNNDSKSNNIHNNNNNISNNNNTNQDNSEKLESFLTSSDSVPSQASPSRSTSSRPRKRTKSKSFLLEGYVKKHYRKRSESVSDHCRDVPAMDELFHSGLITFCTNVDLTQPSWHHHLSALQENMPKWLLFGNDMDLLSLVRQPIPGMSLPQLYLKVPGVWTGGHEENLRFRSLNCNCGPGTCEWFAIEYEHQEMFRQRVLKQYGIDVLAIRGAWYPSQSWLLEQKIPFLHGLQHAGDCVILKGQTLHWVRALGFSNHFSWNFGNLDLEQLEVSLHRYYENAYLSYGGLVIKNIVPMQTLLWDVAMQLLMDSSHRKLIVRLNGNCIEFQRVLVVLAYELILYVSRYLTLLHRLTESTSLRWQLEEPGSMVVFCQNESCQRDIFEGYLLCSICGYRCLQCVPKSCVAKGKHVTHSNYSGSLKSLDTDAAISHATTVVTSHAADCQLLTKQHPQQLVENLRVFLLKYLLSTDNSIQSITNEIVKKLCNAYPPALLFYLFPNSADSNCNYYWGCWDGLVSLVNKQHQ